MVGISFSCFVFTGLIPQYVQQWLWIGHGFYVYALVLTGLAYSLFENQKEVWVKNLPLCLVFIYVNLFSLLLIYQGFVRKVYLIDIMFPYMNFLVFIIFYRLCLNLGRAEIEKILDGLRMVVIITCVTCTLQVLGLSQFFNLLSEDYLKFYEHEYNNLVVGFIGNPTLLSGYLAMCIPLFLYRRTREDWLGLALLLTVLLFAGTKAGEPALSGMIVAWVIFFFYCPKKWVYILLTTLFVLCITPFIPHFMFSDSGRVKWIMEALPYMKAQFVTGYGLGAVGNLYKQGKISTQNLHVEYLQYIFELGLIGLILILNCIKSFLEIYTNDSLMKCLKAVVIGFIVNCFFNYHSHLWMSNLLAMFCYASFFAIENENIQGEHNVRKHTVGNKKFCFGHHSADQCPDRYAR